MIKYFGARSELQCGPKDNPAEYILDVIGAGAGATASAYFWLEATLIISLTSSSTEEDWYGLWKSSDEFAATQRQIDDYHQQYAGRESAADASADSGRGYAAHSYTQFWVVTQRIFQNYWRDPTCMSIFSCFPRVLS